MRRLIYGSIAAILMSSSAMAADAPSAGEPPARAGLRTACADDVKQFCANVEPGGGRIVGCLRENEDKLSQQCKDARAAARSKIERKSAPQ